VKKLWEYIRSHNLQDPNKKSIIRCDDKFRKLCDGASTCSPFNMNKYTQPYFEKIEKEDQPKFKAIFKQQEGLNTVKSEESSN
jgi:chromatin remodeling complex protein RSC6